MNIKLAVVGHEQIDYRVWVVINNHTLSIYMDGQDFDTIYRSYNLGGLKVVKSIQDDKCLNIYSSNYNYNNNND